MEVDKETDGQLAQLARVMQCMGTDDEETIVKNFQQILAPHADLSVDLCRFFLDMNNWNLQAALGSFYDYNAQQMVVQSVPSMQFIADVTVGEGESVPPGSRFIKTWRIRNPNADQWPVGCCLQHIEGDLLADTDHADVGALAPGETADVSVTMTSPPQQGVYQSRWRMFTGSGIPFGEAIWCIIVVDDSGLLELTQRFASAKCSAEPGAVQAQWSLQSSSEATCPQRNPFQSGIKPDTINGEQGIDGHGLAYRKRLAGQSSPVSETHPIPDASIAPEPLESLPGISSIGTEPSKTGNVPTSLWNCNNDNQRSDDCSLFSTTKQELLASSRSDFRPDGSSFSTVNTRPSAFVQAPLSNNSLPFPDNMEN